MMEHSLIVMLLSLLFMLSSFTPLLAHDKVRNTTALKIQLFFPNSPESPLYIKNHTRQQRIEDLIRQTLNRVDKRSLDKIPNVQSNLTQRERMTREEIHVNEGSLILLKLGIGNPQNARNYETYYMHMDTSSELTWLQCEDCLKPPNKCYGNPPIVYPNSISLSYKPIPCGSHEFCYKRECEHDNCSFVCEDDFCSYHKHYNDNSDALGILANETFTFGTGPSENEITRNVAFKVVIGCNIYFDGVRNHGEIGKLSLGWGPRSFLTQLKSQIYESFSYCFPHYDQITSGSKGYLQLGMEVDSSLQGFNSTPLLQFGTESHYYLNLEGISINGKRLKIDRSVFSRDTEHENDGTLIDSGYPFSTLPRIAYNELKKTIIAYFSTLGNYEQIKPGKGVFRFDLCYRSNSSLPYSTDKFPSVTYHFKAADLVLGPENVFIQIDDPRYSFCLAIMPTRLTSTILGAYQQSNIQFVYDKEKKMLFFIREECHVGP